MVFLAMNHTSFLKVFAHPESILRQAIQEHQEQCTFVVVSLKLHLNDIFLHFINENMTIDQNRQGILVFNKPIKYSLQVTFISKKVIDITCIFKSFNGMHLAESHTVYIFFNLQSRKASVLPKHIQQKADLIQHIIVTPNIQAIQRTCEAAIQRMVTVKEEHVDLNNHTDIGVYLICALEAFTDLHREIFPRESSCHITEIQTLNKMESLLGDELHITAWLDTNSKTCNCTITTRGNLVMFLKGRYASSELAKM